MPLTPGDKLGPYEIRALIGKGGMGEVYRAHDDRLRRDVAIKLSKDQFTDRFTREARTIASLNHTNISHLYDVGPNYLVMEYVEGADLKGPLDFDDALPIIQQLIDGIEAAHEKNVIHRDLKPANIKITPEGVVKILDFGLAKAMEPAHDIDPENSPTLTMGGTVAGTILGTAAYMSPEQAKGKTADKRSDVFSFGVVLYELLTGKRLFQGDSVVEILGGVLNKQADISVAPARVHKLLNWCLEKDRKLRLASISDARHLLLPSATPEPVTPVPTKGRTWLPWAIATFVLLALIPGNVLHYLETPPPQPALNTSLLPPENTDFDFNGLSALPAISPDGTRIVFGARPKTGRKQLWLRRLDSATAQPLPGTEDAGLPFWSPNSRWIAFVQGTKLKKIDIQGGPPIPITDLPAIFRGGTWGPDDVILYSIDDNPILRVAASGGKAVAVSASRNDRYPWFLPDGRHFLYVTAQTLDMPVQVGSLDEPAKPAKVVAQANSPAVYAQGHLLYLRETTLMAQAFDAGRLETAGEAMPLAEGIPTFGALVRVGGFAVSPAGLLAFMNGFGAGQTQLRWKDRQGKLLGDFGERISVTGNIAISPDQKNVAVAFGGPLDVWIYNAARALPTRLTFDIATDREPVWSPDGKTIYFSSNRGRGNFNLYRKASNGTGTEELFLEDEADKTPVAFSPDGRLLLYYRNDSKTQSDIWVLPVGPETGNAKPQPRVFLQTPFSELRAQFSPEGQWVVYQSNESGQNEIYVAPFPGPGGKRQISSGGGIKPRWRRDGKEIFYLTDEGQLMAAEVLARNGTLEVGKLQKLFDGIVTARGYLYDVSADGQKFLVADEGGAASRPLTLLQNWTALLRK